ncbi:tyrosine-protein kinase STK-like [Saccoglossus kowalevskii]|uniref:Tyrosine-protein kinase n=1 Tax=Saccoglossus kowalevskii TaxID=10224 RepID=A0ABM0LUK1_SACKO|nr:PREDICTED: proto-oncogene tyrosine-protein kinase Src-like [Saccoglossus kowalevskii]
MGGSSSKQKRNKKKRHSAPDLRPSAIPPQLHHANTSPAFFTLPPAGTSQPTTNSYPQPTQFHKQPNVRPPMPTPHVPVIPAHGVSASRDQALHPGAQQGDQNIYVAVFSYTALNDEDLTFKKGDRFRVRDKGQGPWWIATLLSTSREGYIPSNYVEEEVNMKSQKWFFGDINRREAERGLMSRFSERGAFLIRESERFPGCYTLSLLDHDLSTGKVVKHFKIRALDKGGFYISPKMTFASLQDLVFYYKDAPHGLPTRLVEPCAKMTPMVPGITWETPRESIQLQKRIGDGQFGEVFKGVWNRRTPVAVKCMKAGSMFPQEFLKEAEIMKNLRHDHLLQLLAVCSDREPIYIVTELMSNGSLLEYLRNERDEERMLTEGQLIDMMAQVASGMQYLEANNYIHRDLAARNVLVGENNLCKVADFGLTRLINGEYIAQRDTKFPVKWTAPEAANYQRFTIKSDVWSFGILMFEIITKGRVPYAALGTQETLNFLARNERMAKPHECSNALYELMLKCWEQEPFNRPTFEFMFSYLDAFSISSQEQYSEDYT